MHGGLQTLAPVSSASLQHFSNTLRQESRQEDRRKVDIASYTHFWSLLVADWNRNLSLFGWFPTRLLFLIVSGLWNCLSWSFSAAREIFLELDSVWVELIDNMKLLSRLHFGHIVFTNHQRIYGSGVQTQLERIWQKNLVNNELQAYTQVQVSSSPVSLWRILCCTLLAVQL